MIRTDVYVLSYNRPELLACCLGSLSGFNSGLPIHVIDDGSSDGRVRSLLAAYKECGLIESVDPQPHRGIGPLRRRMIDRFLLDGADRLVQVESDVSVGPGQVTALVDAYAALKAYAPDAHFLNAFHHFWVRPQLRVLAWRNGASYRVGITKGASEPFWISDRDSLRRAVAEGLLPADRPDMVLWLDKYCGATLYQPEIACQHIGAGRASLLYNNFSWEHVVFRRENERLQDSGPLRQPFPDYPLHWPEFQDKMPLSALALYEFLRSRSPVPLPEFPT